MMLVAAVSAQLASTGSTIDRQVLNVQIQLEVCFSALTQQCHSGLPDVLEEGLPLTRVQAPSSRRSRQLNPSKISTLNDQ